MTEYISETKIIPYSEEDVFSAFSDLRKLERIQKDLPQDKVKNLTYDKDSCSIDVSPIGKIRFVVVERNPNSTIKFEAEQVPFKLSLSVQLKEEVAHEKTSMFLKVDADISPFLKPLVSKPLQEVLEKMAEALSSIPFETLKD